MGAGQSNIDISKLNTREPNNISEKDIASRLDFAIDRIKKQLNTRSDLITNKKVKTDVLLSEVAKMCKYLDRNLHYDAETIYNIRLLNQLKQKYNVYDSKSLDDFVTELKKLAVIEEKNKLLKEKEESERKLSQAKQIIRKQEERQVALKAKLRAQMDKHMDDQKRKRAANNAEKQKIKKQTRNQVLQQIRKQKSKKTDNREKFLKKYGKSINNIKFSRRNNTNSVYSNDSRTTKRKLQQKRIQQKAKELMAKQTQKRRVQQTKTQQIKRRLRSQMNLQSRRINNLKIKAQQHERGRRAELQAVRRGAIAETESRIASTTPTTVQYKPRLSQEGLRRHLSAFPTLSATNKIKHWPGLYSS
jgi:hypothetical protein